MPTALVHLHQAFADMIMHTMSLPYSTEALTPRFPGHKCVFLGNEPPWYPKLVSSIPPTLKFCSFTLHPVNTIAYKSSGYVYIIASSEVLSIQQALITSSYLWCIFLGSCFLELRVQSTPNSQSLSWVPCVSLAFTRFLQACFLTVIFLNKLVIPYIKLQLLQKSCENILSLILEHMIDTIFCEISFHFQQHVLIPWYYVCVSPLSQLKKMMFQSLFL